MATRTNACLACHQTMTRAMSNRGGGEELKYVTTKGKQGASMMESTLRSEANATDTRMQRNKVGTLADDEVQWSRARARMAIGARGRKQGGKRVGTVRMLTTNTLVCSDGGNEVEVTGINEDTTAAVGEEEEYEDGTWHPTVR